MAQTLIEAAKVALGRNQVLKATVMELYARGSDVLQYMPFENISGNSLAFNRENLLPGVGFRGINEAYTESVGQLDRVTEALTIAGGDLDVDVFLVKTMGPDQRPTQEGMKIKALSLAITLTTIKGDVLVQPREFDGLQVRCTGNQNVDNQSLGLSLARLDLAIDECDEPTHLIMSKDTRRRLSAAARAAAVGGYITYELDAFGRRVTYYNDLPILIADRDQFNNLILDFTEASARGTLATACSLYVVSFAENGVMGLQNGEMEVRDLGELQAGAPVYRTRIEWYITMAILRPRAAVRLNSIQDAVARV